MFANREEAARQLAKALSCHPLHRPVVLAIPRGGVVIGEILADALDADLDVVLAWKLRGPNQSECAIGVISENGCVHLDPAFEDFSPFTKSIYPRSDVFNSPKLPAVRNFIVGSTRLLTWSIGHRHR